MNLRTGIQMVPLAAMLLAGAAWAEGGSGVGKDITARVNLYCDNAITALNNATQTASLALTEGDYEDALKTLEQGLADAAAIETPPTPSEPGQPPVPAPPPLDSVVRRAIDHARELLTALEGGMMQPPNPSGPSGPLPPGAVLSPKTLVKFLVGQYGFITGLSRDVDRPIFNWQELLCEGCSHAWASAERRYEYFVAKEIGAAISRDVILLPTGEIKVIDLSKTGDSHRIIWLRETQVGPGWSDVKVAPVESIPGFLKIAEYTALFAADDLEGPVQKPGSDGGPNGDSGSIFSSSRCAAGDLRNLSLRLRDHNSGGNTYRKNDVAATKIARDVLVHALDTIVRGCR